MNFGRAIKQIRDKREIELSVLVKKSKLSRVYISQIENNHRTPSDEAIKKIAKALGVSPQVIYALAIDNQEKNEKNKSYFDEVVSITHSLVDKYLNKIS
jgi:transcriptional regulator with XRE-family HTH domain